GSKIRNREKRTQNRSLGKAKTTVYLAGHCGSRYSICCIRFCDYPLPTSRQPAKADGRRGTAARTRKTIGGCTGDTGRRGGGAYTPGQRPARRTGQYALPRQV